jgi:hypothetical protein
MKRETYKGRNIKVVKGRGADLGHTRIVLNGVEMGSWLGDEDEALRSTRGTIDHADEVGAGSGRYGAEWYAPGTYELCDEGHPKEIGGECGHHWCVAQCAKAAPVVDEAPAEVTDTVDTDRYERVSLDDLKKGDLIILPNVMIGGNVASWGGRSYTVDRIEHRAPGVVFIWRQADDLPPKSTMDRFMMVCGDRVPAGVLRVKPAPVAVPVELTA